MSVNVGSNVHTNKMTSSKCYHSILLVCYCQVSSWLLQSECPVTIWQQGAAAELLILPAIIPKGNSVDCIVTRCSTHLKNRHIKSSTTQVKDQDGLIALLLKAIGQRSCGGLIDDTQHIQAGNAASVLGSLPLRVIEICWHCDYSLLHLQCICNRCQPHSNGCHIEQKLTNTHC